MPKTRPDTGISETQVLLRCPKALDDAMRTLAEDLGRSKSYLWRLAAVQILKAHGVEIEQGKP